MTSKSNSLPSLLAVPNYQTHLAISLKYPPAGLGPSAPWTDHYEDRGGHTGGVNVAPFRNFAAGEVLFIGAKRGKDDWEITFRFAALPNVTNLTIGPITEKSKRGWELLWDRYVEDYEAANRSLRRKGL